MLVFILDNATYICLGLGMIGAPAYVMIKKFLGYQPPQVFRTTEYKKKFKKHQIQFNEQFKQ